MVLFELPDVLLVSDVPVEERIRVGALTTTTVPEVEEPM